LANSAAEDRWFLVDAGGEMTLRFRALLFDRPPRSARAAVQIRSPFALIAYAHAILRRAEHGLSACSPRRLGSVSSAGQPSDTARGRK